VKRGAGYFMQTTKVKNKRLPSKDGKSQLHVVIWEPQGQVKAILQIAHGMVEYIERYDAFARYLNKKGILVVGNDHIGHGHTAKEKDLGYFTPDHMSATVVCDLHRVTKCMKKRYPDVPYYLLGHSMGSFMVRRYLMTFGEEIDGAILCGTGSHSKAILTIGKVAADLSGLARGERHRSRMLEILFFGTYNRRVPRAERKNETDWISKEPQVREQKMQNKLSNFTFTVNGYRTLLDVLSYIQRQENIEKIPKTLPIFLIAGQEDPVGNYGKGVRQVYKSYKNAGILDVDIKLYKGDRHEILNEKDREQVFEDILSWMHC